MPSSLFRHQIALPQDHGSWVFILSPLSIGLFAASEFNVASLALLVAAMAAFLVRQPVTMALKAYSGRRPRTDLPAARFWMVFYGVIIFLSVAELVTLHYTYVLWLAMPGGLIFAWHLYLVSKRAERRQAGIEILATGVLALAAPAAFWIGNGSYSPWGWALWLLAWFQSAASIVYAYLRLEQRDLKQIPDTRTRWKMGQRALAYTTFNVIVTTAMGLSGILPHLIALPYLVQWLETLWGIMNPAVGAKPTHIGIRQLIVSVLFTIIFILTWNFS